MALKQCTECKNQVSDQAKKCPHCGAPVKSGSIIGLLVKLFLVVVVFIFIGNLINSPSRQPSSATDQATSSLNSEESPGVMEPPLELQSWNWGEEYSHAIANGVVKNISSDKIKNVTAVVQFYDKEGTFITSADALIDYNPIMPNQTSPFKVITTYNPAMTKARIEFKTLSGEPLNFKDKPSKK